MCCHLLWLPPIKILRQCQTNQTWDSKSWFTVLTWLEILIWILDLMLVYQYFQILCTQDRQTRVISRDASASKYIIPTLSSLWTSWEQGSEPVFGKGSSVITFKDTTVSAMQKAKGLVSQLCNQLQHSSRTEVGCGLRRHIYPTPVTLLILQLDQFILAVAGSTV